LKLRKIVLFHVGGLPGWGGRMQSSWGLSSLSSSVMIQNGPLLSPGWKMNVCMSLALMVHGCMQR
jgi:hypothetical protein